MIRDGNNKSILQITRFHLYMKPIRYLEDLTEC